ncbi:hypothetical protein ACJRO7_009252 [Eucalyptus globulus]|uniref:Pentatricopeptide repeat-containing protein n=1 Tax=Eucalyptus globulus TaxID=34317 RepID=A0ABD3L835_EUCGL
MSTALANCYHPTTQHLPNCNRSSSSRPVTGSRGPIHLAGPHRALPPLLAECTHLVQFKQIHAHILKTSPHHQHRRTDSGLTQLVLSLLGPGSGHAHLDYTRAVFDQVAHPSAFLCNTLLRACALHGLGSRGIRVYHQMMLRDVDPDAYTYPFLLKACSDLGQGKGVHSLVLKHDVLCSHLHALTSLVAFYCRCGDLGSARSLFDRMTQRNLVSWTAMISGYTKHMRYQEGLALFREMLLSGVGINELTLVSVLSACAHLGDLGVGRRVHCYIHRNHIPLNPLLAAALIDMYAKCGHMDKASRVFQTAPVRSVSTWNSLIGGLAIHGCGREALERFQQMQMDGTKPDDVTFIALLSACSHSGLAEEGQEIFYSMRGDSGIQPTIKHFGCLVDLLCRAGQIEEAYQVMIDMPMEPNEFLWGALLNACARDGNVSLAERAMEKLVELEPFNDGNYALMSNVYAANEQWNDVGKVRRLMKDMQIIKNPGLSLIEVDNIVHEFMAADIKHPFLGEIDSTLEDLMMTIS